jgi:hypothetical protein
MEMDYGVIAFDLENCIAHVALNFSPLKNSNTSGQTSTALEAN